MATPSAPGALLVTPTRDMLVDVFTGGPQSSVANLGSIVDLGGGVGDAVSTAITTVGAGTLTAAAIVGGVIVRSGPTAAFTDTTATAALIIAALPASSQVGASWLLTIKNLTAFSETLAAGTGVTLSGNKDVIPANSAGVYLVTYASASTVTILGLYVVPLTGGLPESVTALTTVGAGTITAAGIAGGATARSGSTSAFTDTTDTADNIIAAVPNARIGQSFEYTYRNNTLAAATLTGGTGVTVSGITVVPKNTWARFLVTYTAASTLTIVGLAAGQTVVLPPSQSTTGSAATFAAGAITGANIVNYENTGANATLTVRTAAQMFADIPNCQAGFTYQLFIRNTNATGATITADGGATVTLTGTMTIAQNVTRMFNVTFTSATAATIQSMGISAAGA